MIGTPLRPLTRPLRVAGFANFMGRLDNDHPAAYARAADQGEKLATLADDLRAKAKADLARYGNGTSEGRGRGWTHD